MIMILLQLLLSVAFELGRQEAILYMFVQFSCLALQSGYGLL